MALMSGQRDIYSVSRLNAETRAVLEGSFPLLWVEGEISNLARPASGHIYFILKDPHAQVRCAMFRMRRTHLRFQPENGQQVLIRARVSLYEGRGEFQLIAEHMEPSGEGALRQAFEELKQRLGAEGLFAEEFKKPLPPFPRRVGVITSASGAAIRDVLSVLKRRFPAIQVIIYPVLVQGAEAPQQIMEMIQLADRRSECDLLLLTRGGGSLEDLMAFNDEGVARAIHKAELPIVSAVGHEIDFTITDFVADLRAATPSAAAEAISPDRTELEQKLLGLSARLNSHQRLQLAAREKEATQLHQRLRRLHPGARLQQQQQRCDELEKRLCQAIQHKLRHYRSRLQTQQAQLQANTPSHQLEQATLRYASLHQLLHNHMLHQVQGARQRFAAACHQLQTVSPLATLNRGYAIVHHLPSGEILRDADQIAVGDKVKAKLGKGSLICTVDQKSQ